MVDELYYEDQESSNVERLKLWIVTDARRKTDIDYFISKYPGKIKKIRVFADESIRTERNWEFLPGISIIYAD